MTRIKTLSRYDADVLPGKLIAATDNRHREAYATCHTKMIGMLSTQQYNMSTQSMKTIYNGTTNVKKAAHENINTLKH